MTPAVLRKFNEIAEPGRVTTDPAALVDYGRDESPGPEFLPEALIRVKSVDEVVAAVKLCRDERIPVTPRGLGTGLAGGAVPIHGGVVLSTELMTQVVEVDVDNLVVRTRPGVVVEKLQQACEQEGLFYPVDPASLDTCSIGGNVATNAGGARAFKYGVTRDYVRGLQAVTADGRIINYGGKLRKNATGYDLNALLVGSEGTLGIVTEVTLRLVPKPRHRVDILIPFERLAQGVELVLRVVHDTRLVPAVVEFIERKGIRACNEKLGSELPFPDARVQVLVELEGNNLDQVLDNCVRLGGIAMELGAEEPLVADNPADQDRLWTARRKLAETLKDIYPEVVAEDIVLPLSRLPATVERIARLEKKHGLTVVPFGHIGDGNIHVDICRTHGTDPSSWRKTCDAFVDELVDYVLGSGGQISAEHGIGTEKKRLMPKALGSSELDAMRALKRALDPDNILNPGKILP
ncbi:MAG: FAD-binding oxidoreductase [candidate division WOR-3 bacterium]|nr:MAG: FAD-binding oxidoreductase [candidate division WOR-3 bacterium]